jgi:hypothetical protein
MAVLTLAEIKTHLRIEQSDSSQNAALESLEAAAVDYATQYIGRSIPWTDDAGVEQDVPQSVKQALLLLIGDYDQQRENSVIGLSYASTKLAENMLHFYRVGMGI